MVWEHSYDPLGSPVLSTLVAAVPLILLLGLLACAGWSGMRSALAALAAAILIAVGVVGMPADAAAAAAVNGGLFGLFPIGWIILAAMFLYRLSVEAGALDIMKRSVTGLSADHRLQALLIAFSFGAFLEGAAGFGAPVAISAALMVGAGFPAIEAACLALIANTAPVAFGALGTPIITLAKVTGLDERAISAMAGHQLPLFSLLVPAWMVCTMAGWRGVVGVWPAVLVCGGTFAVVQYAMATFVGAGLVDVVGGVSSLVALAVFLHRWKPQECWRHGEGWSRSSIDALPDGLAIGAPLSDSPGRITWAWMPWGFLSLAVFLWGLPTTKACLEGHGAGAFLPAAIACPEVNVPFLDGRIAKVPPATRQPREIERAVYRFNWLSAAGTGIFVAAMLSVPWLGVSWRRAIVIFGQTIHGLTESLATIAAMLALAFVTRSSGTDVTLGLALTATGTAYAFFAPLLGWLGVALTGSDTSSNAMFGSLQRVTAEQLGLDPLLICTANSTGGVMGKMIDAQSIVVSATATGTHRREGEILRRVFPHSLALAALMGLLVWLQAGPLSWMVPVTTGSGSGDSQEFSAASTNYPGEKTVKLAMSLAVTTFAACPAATSDAAPGPHDSRGFEAVDIAAVWAGHPVGFALLTVSDRQYVAYYAADRHLTVASRALAGRTWELFRLPSAQPGPPTEPGQTSAVTGWDSHNGIVMAVDETGHLHLAGNMHNNGLTYYRTRAPAAIETFEQVPAMVGREERRCTYPLFLKRTDGRLLFRYRSGGSGNGSDYFNIYDESTRSWRRLCEKPLFDGEGMRSAYAQRPMLGPDGRYHMSWVWRDTPDCSTNHDLCYARSSDLAEWESVDGRSLTLPIRLESPGLSVDPVPVDGGILNGTGSVGFDARGRPVLAYFKYDPEGRSQAFVARHEGDAWRIRHISDWNDRFELGGGGSLPTAHIHLGAVEPAAVGELRLAFSHATAGDGEWILDDESLAIVRTEPAPSGSLPASLMRVASSFPGMAVRTAEDLGKSGIPGRRFVLRWETLGANRDQPREAPWPEPSMLRVVEVDDPVEKGHATKASQRHEARGPLLVRPTDKTNEPTDRPDMRAADLLSRCIAIEPARPRFAKEALVPFVARLLAGRDVPRAVSGWLAAAEAANQTATPKAPSTIPDPFNKHALVHAWMLCRESPHLPAEVKPRIAAATRDYVCRYGHREWRGYGALNFRLMSDGAGLIAAEQWPDLHDADGLDSAGIHAATRERLLGYFEEIVHRNNAEYGAPTYLGVNLAALKMLADFAEDDTVRHRATLTLDTMLLHLACSWHRGYHVSPASRAKGFESSMTGPDAMDCTAAIGWLFFGAERPVRGLCEHHSGWFAFPATYEPPAILATIAADRTAAFTHRGSRGDRIRFTIHHEPAYALASEWTLLKTARDYHYKESRRQMLKWVSDHPQSSFMPFQENAHRPYDLTENKANAFGYGENPFSQTLQHGRTLVGVTAVPDDYPYWRIEAPFSTTGSILKRIERHGWVCCHAGSMLFAFWLGGEPRWTAHRDAERCDVLTSDARRTGWILETSPLAEFAGEGPDAELDRFATALVARTKVDASQLSAEWPRLVFTSLSGHVLEITYRPHGEAPDDEHRIDGERVDYASFPLLGNPWVRQALDGDDLVIEHGEKTLRYDFRTWTRHASP